ncbi:CPCC family cysteine-rich protein [Peribacillus sp. NPDC060186]
MLNCCGYRTLGETPPGTQGIFEICFCEDEYDYFQYDHPDMDSGVNDVSL